MVYVAKWFYVVMWCYMVKWFYVAKSGDFMWLKVVILCG